MQTRNMSSPLSRRRSSSPMRDYDSLPPELRRWLSQAALPWSARSARRIWQQGLRQGGPQDALARLQAAEEATLRREAGLKA